MRTSLLRRCVKYYCWNRIVSGDKTKTFNCGYYKEVPFRFRCLCRLVIHAPGHHRSCRRSLPRLQCISPRLTRRRSHVAGAIQVIQLQPGTSPRHLRGGPSLLLPPPQRHRFVRSKQQHRFQPRHCPRCQRLPSPNHHTMPREHEHRERGHSWKHQ